MKTLQIFMSRDLEERVVRALDDAGAEGYLRVGEATGNQFAPAGQVPRRVTWEAVMLVVPAASDEVVERLTKSLRDYAGSCEIEPCLRLIAQGSERVL